MTGVQTCALPIYAETVHGSVRNYERPEVYDGRQLAQDILAQHSGVVADGLFPFVYPELLDLSAHRFYLDLPFTVCLARRLARRPTRSSSDRSFALIGEQESETFVVPQKTLSDIHVLDGNKPQEALLQEVLVNIGSC